MKHLFLILTLSLSPLFSNSCAELFWKSETISFCAPQDYKSLKWQRTKNSKTTTTSVLFSNDSTYISYPNDTSLYIKETSGDSTFCFNPESGRTDTTILNDTLYIQDVIHKKQTDSTIIEYEVYEKTSPHEVNFTFDKKTNTLYTNTADYNCNYKEETCYCTPTDKDSSKYYRMYNKELEVKKDLYTAGYNEFGEYIESFFVDSIFFNHLNISPIATQSRKKSNFITVFKPDGRILFNGKTEEYIKKFPPHTRKINQHQTNN